MNYVIRLTPIAEDDMKRLPPPAAVFVAQRLLLLAEHPTALSKPSHFPYPPNAQLFEFDRYLDPETREFFHVLFKYGADEKTIFIMGIARQVSDFWWGKGQT